MRAKPLMLIISTIVLLAVPFELVAAISRETTAQNANSNTNRSPRRNRGRRPPPPPPSDSVTPPTDTAQAEPTAGTTTQQRRRRGNRGRARARANTGVPTGVQNCIDALIEIAGNDPLVPYDGRPEEIVNNGLMWNDPKSKCSVGTDSALRLKLFNLSNAWRRNNASEVRSLLQEIKSSAPQ